MNFEEIKPKPYDPKFTLTLSLVDAVDLWRIVCLAEDQGVQAASKFVDALTEFASNSNHYTEYLNGRDI
ncbi:hypothetical protein [Paenibacillus sp. USHLN196]|uniref:hypothetical protein n=1 Tax=Paenibacillus sp. USHLN196 TaxID=3081291 RepID=UPI00301AFC81